MFPILLSILSPLFPLTAGRKRRGSLLWYYMYTCFCAGLCITLIHYALHSNYHWLTNIYFLSEFVFLSLYYKKEVFQAETSFYLFSLLFLAVFIFYTSFSEEGWSTFNAANACIPALYYLLCSFKGFYTLIREQKISFLEKSSFFWANTAVILYATGIFIIVLLSNKLQDRETTIKVEQYTFLCLYSLKNILIGIALGRKKP
jgi:hypothetical protein